MEFKIDKGTGYLYCYSPQHYTANSAGKVLQHVYVMCEAIGRPLKPDECVHHIDRDKTNNNLSNLRLMTNSEHGLLHAIEDRGFKTQTKLCPTCDKNFTISSKSTQKFCSFYCSNIERTQFTVTREDLYLMVWTQPTVQVAKALNVSDVAVAKRCKKLNVPKPPRGYWAKIYAGIIPTITPLN